MQEVEYIELDCRHIEGRTVMSLACKPGDGSVLRDALLEYNDNLIKSNNRKPTEVSISLNGTHNSYNDVVTITINKKCKIRDLSDAIEKICRVKHVSALENYTLQEGDKNVYVTTSVAYLAQHANINCMHEPWLHVRICQRLVIRGREVVSNEIGYVVYVWDTREVVQWIDAKQNGALSLKTPKAVDNAKPLKDTKHLLPDWVIEDVTHSGNLWSMANMPKEVQDRYYNR